jgi:hypothetical protein|tara:strand:+ start:388 stop:570 length:183 start_codon:yes stop_codon:yes gene_type:complete
MIELLLYSTLTCAQADELISRVNEYQQRTGDISKVDAVELVETIKQSTPECFNEGSKQNP